MIARKKLLIFLFLGAIGSVGVAAESEHSSFKANEAESHAAPVSETSTEAAPAVKSAAVGISQGSWDSCLPDASVVEDLKKRQKDLDAREKDLRAKETDLKAREAAMNEELRKLDLLRKDLSGLRASKKQKNDEQIAKLIETLEKMSPKAAAPLLAKVDEDLAVSAMAGLSTPQLAKIISNMEPSRSVRLTELLAMGESAPNREGGANGRPAQP